MTRIKVAVRVRPLSNREVEAGSISIVAVENGNTVAVTNVKVPEQNAGDSRERVRRFTFDYCLTENSTQDHIFERIEDVIGQSIKRRFHSCVLAYGQSASGKTHTMMGFPHDPGLTPKLCHRVFQYLQETAVGDEVMDLKVSVSYLEIYNEKVRDLLCSEEAVDGSSLKKRLPLRVREHPKKGPYVQGLSEHPVTDSAGLLEWLDRGNKQRRTAATLTNPQSSRSHSVFSINCDGVKLHLIDLAGSERAGSRCYSTPQFREGANINKSLVALGNVISVLAEQSSKQVKSIRRKFVPYRDSVLTWLLKDTLGGNSNTVMVATISPSSTCYNETVNTLRFGQRAKLIVSHPVVNEDPKEKTIRELRAEISRLKDLLTLSQFPLQISSMSERTTDDTPAQEQHPVRENECEYVTTPSPIPENDETVEDIQKEPIVFDAAIDTNSCASVNEKDDNQVSFDSPQHKDTHLTSSPKEAGTLDQTFKSTTERLVPLIKVSSTVRPARPTKLRRTYSVDHTYNKMERSALKMFASQESIPSSSNASRKPSSSTISAQKRSQEVFKKSNVSNNTLSHRKPPVKREPPERTTKKIEKAIATESTNFKTIEAKVDSVRKTNIKPRSHIVAAVTNRLYSKMKKKEASTNTDDISTHKTELPKELTICSNARARLRELTQKALRAHRQKSEETQTDLFPVLRVKEMSTDVDDLRVVLAEVKDVETEPDVVETRDACIECNFLNQFSDEKSIDNHSIVFTRTCGTQSIEDLSDETTSTAASRRDHSLQSSNEPPSTSMSFTKYLRECQSSKIDVSNVVPTSSPIYTNTVNINISHNYIHRNEDVSEDSAYGPSQNVCFPTPDLISNHNSLEQQNTVSSNWSSEKSNVDKVLFANTNVLHDQFSSVQSTISEHESKMNTVVGFSIVPSCMERIQSVNIAKVQAPEICIVKGFESEFCSPLPEFILNLAKPKIIEYEDIKCDCVKLKEPLVLKSIVKQCPNYFNYPFEAYEETTFTAELPDSLDYHMANNKKVKFSKEHGQLENQRIVKAMSSFLEEATQLMNNLTFAANDLSNSRLLSDSYELEVTLNDITRLGKSVRRRRKLGHSAVVKQQKDNKHSETVERSDRSTQCKLDQNIPVNKYEVLVEDSCRRLEEKINRTPNTPPRVNTNGDYSNFNDDTLDQYLELGYNPWDLSHHSNDNDVEDSSLESNPVAFSDYGSLPRKTHKRHRTPTCSPSAFLKQLTNMRRQIIESSREELLGCSNGH